MDMFYTDPNGLILEHWDTIAPYQPSTASGADMVRGTTTIDTKANKSLILEFTKQVMQGQQHTKTGDFVARDVIRHAAAIGPGHEGWAAWLSGDGGSYEILFKLIGQGDTVVTYGKRHAAGKDFAVFNVYRVVENKIVEHWMNEEEIGPREAWGNSEKF